MLSDIEVIDRMIDKQNEIAEARADAYHERMMRTDDDYFIKHSEYLEEYQNSRENFVKELKRYDLAFSPEEYLW